MSSIKPLDYILEEVLNNHSNKGLLEPYPCIPYFDNNAFFAVYGWYQYIKPLLLNTNSIELNHKYTRVLLLSYYINCMKHFCDESLPPPPSPFNYKSIVNTDMMDIRLDEEEERLQRVVDDIRSLRSEDTITEIDESISKLEHEADELNKISSNDVRE